MGQQQLLYIVLGVILIGISVVFGISLFESYSVDSKKDAIIDELSTMGSMAQQHYSKPALLGGGGYSFVNWDIPENMKNTPNAVYTVTTKTISGVTIKAVSSEMLTGNVPITFELVISPNNFQITDITGGE